MVEMSGLLNGKTAVVTGAAQGIGLAISTAFARAGATVLCTDLDESRVGVAARGIGPSAVPMVCDVTKEQNVEAVADRGVREFGRVDIWVNNAGLTRDASLRTMTLDDFRTVVDVHLVGAWLGVRAAAGIMREQKSGSIVNISSLSGKAGNPGQTNYSAAKAGVVGLTKAAAKELARHNIRVNAVQPGLIRTPMTAAMPAAVFAAREADIPLGRAGDADEVAHVVAFLASDLSTYMTGAVLEVGGGRLI